MHATQSVRLTEDASMEDQSASDAGYLAMKARAEGTNVNPETLLATDYLNHFNEIVMLLEMVPDMPEIMEDVRAWQPKSYVQHFKDSTIADRELAVEAFDHVPPRYREPFDQTIEQLDAFIISTIRCLDDYIARQDDELLREQTKVMSQMIQRLLDTAGGIIHGGTKTMVQADIDAILG